jgi:hypothetical protein
VVDDSQATSTDKVTISNGKANNVQLGMAPADQFFGSLGGLDVTGMGSLTLNLSKAKNDVVHLSPSTTTAFAIQGDLSAYQAGFGAELDIVLGETTDAVLRPTPGVKVPAHGTSPGRATCRSATPTWRKRCRNEMRPTRPAAS